MKRLWFLTIGLVDAKTLFEWLWHNHDAGENNLGSAFVASSPPT